LNDILIKDQQADLNFKMLERIRGYLRHLGMTYDINFPYLKGFHLLLWCVHLPCRNNEGAKLERLNGWDIWLKESLLENYQKMNIKTQSKKSLATQQILCQSNLFPDFYHFCKHLSNSSPL